MPLANTSAPNLTAMAARLPKEDLALMATIIDELSFWERYALLPFLAMDIYFLKFWLLTGVDEFGMLATSKHRRRAARGDIFHSIARARWLTNDKYVVFAPTPLTGFFSLARQAFFWTHLGPPAGQRKELQFEKSDTLKVISALGTVFLLLAFLFTAMAFDMHKASLDMDHPSFLVSLVGPGVLVRTSATILPLFGLLRLGIYLFTPGAAKLASAAQGATPLAWRTLNGLRAYFEQRLESARNKQAIVRSMKFDAIRAAITRASLGQDPTHEEIEFDRLAGIQTALREAALQSASNPDLALAKMEQAALSSDAPPDDQRRSKSL